MSDWRPSASAVALRQRAELLSRVRDFFARRGVVEVQTPLITASGVTDLQIESVATDNPAGWLRTSPEYFHKRLLASGFGDLYELGPVFRRGEAGRHHQPEFTLLEWYRVGWTWRCLAEEVVALIDHALAGPRGGMRVRWLSWNDAFLASLGIDALTADTGELAQLADDAPAGLERDALLDWLFATRIQPAFDDNALTVVYDYPASQAALARIHPDDPRVAERFEVFAGALELANGYRELTDALEQRRRFKHDNRLRRDNDKTPMPIDTALLEAMTEGLPECAGVALGFDRLLMAAGREDTIERVVSFAHRPSS